MKSDEVKMGHIPKRVEVVEDDEVLAEIAGLGTIQHRLGLGVRVFHHVGVDLHRDARMRQEARHRDELAAMVAFCSTQSKPRGGAEYKPS